MGEKEEVFLGFDPGGETGNDGKGKFGWAVCRANAGQFELCDDGIGVARYAEDAVDKASKKLPANSKVVAVGIDAPMFWNITGEKRKVDGIIQAALVQTRYKYRVMTINELQGACLVQGILAGAELYQRFKAPITEVHPRALRYLLRHLSPDDSLPDELERYEAELRLSESDNDNDEWDALAAAYAAWCMHRQEPGWSDLFPREPNPILPLGTPVSYWMPIPLPPADWAVANWGQVL